MEPRVATLKDLDALVELARREFNRSRVAGMPWDEGHVRGGLHWAITGISSIVFLTNGGFLVAMIGAWPFGGRVAHELCWYAEDGRGARLLRAFHDWSRRMGATHTIVRGTSGIVDDDSMARVMRRKGYEDWGRMYARPTGA